jgi:thioredoxin-like negative regulator of GroEL
MLPTGVLFLWCLVAQAQEPGSAEAPTITNRATDPWGALGKAEQLLRSDRPDEAVATLHAASSDPVTAEAAKRQLAAALLTLPPRPAWAAAYARALSSPGVPQRSELELRALRAAGMDPSRHSAARSQLTELLRRSPGDVDIRYALGEVLLRGGQPDKAL